MSLSRNLFGREPRPHCRQRCLDNQ